MQWIPKGSKSLLETPPFSIEEVYLEEKQQGKKLAYYRIKCRNWVNVLAITDDGKAIFIRQSRVGSMSDTIEIPGGVIDASDPNPEVAAQRELEEETGYRARHWQYLGQINPNPAIMTNDLRMFLATGAFIPEDRRCFPDTNESISIELVSIAEAVAMARSGKVHSALAALTVLIAEPHLSID